MMDAWPKNCRWGIHSTDKLVLLVEVDGCASSFLFSCGFLKAMNKASRILRFCQLCCPVIIFHVNECRGNSSRCLSGSETLVVSECSSIGTLKCVSPTYLAPQPHLPSYATWDLRMLLSFRLKKDFIFLVSQITMEIQLFRVKLVSLFINVKLGFSFLSQNGILTVIRLISSNTCRLVGIIGSSSCERSWNDLIVSSTKYLG